MTPNNIVELKIKLDSASCYEEKIQFVRQAFIEILNRNFKSNEILEIIQLLPTLQTQVLDTLKQTLLECSRIYQLQSKLADLLSTLYNKPTDYKTFAVECLALLAIDTPEYEEFIHSSVSDEIKSQLLQRLAELSMSGMIARNQSIPLYTFFNFQSI